ncbi:MAG: ferrous iron transport protein A [Treponema sp.]|nr:ferrous iron transport protein A [Treponema sp.]
MKKLTDLKANQSGQVVSVNGDTRFVSRITSIGITPGCRLTVIKNEKRRPIIVWARDTMIALNSKECSNIEVEA